MFSGFIDPPGSLSIGVLLTQQQGPLDNFPIHPSFQSAEESAGVIDANRIAGMLEQGVIVWRQNVKYGVSFRGAC